MKYALRKIYTVENGYNKTISPTVGNIVEFEQGQAYDNITIFYPNPEGLFLIPLNGYVQYMDGDTYIIASYEDEDVTIIPNDPGALFVSKFKIEYVTTEPNETLLSYFDFSQVYSYKAIIWAEYFHNYDQVIDYVTDQADMTSWVLYVRASDHDRFAPFITDQNYIYSWASDIGDDNFFPLIVNQDLLFSYAINHTDRLDWVKPKITDPFWISVWNGFFVDDPIISVTPTPSADVEPTPEPSVEVSPEVSPEPTPDVTPTPSQM